MRCKIRGQASKTTQCRAINRCYTLTQWQQWLAKTTQTTALLMLLGTGLWLTTEANSQQIALAKTARVDLSIERQPNETYEALLSRAQVAAKAAVQESFDQNKDATDVSINVVAHHQGAIAPILSLDVSRSQWRRSSNTQNWLTHFSSARSLLGFDEGVADNNSNNRRRNNNSTRSIQNNRSRRARERVNGTFSQPGSLVTPSTSTQPINNTPSQSGISSPSTIPSSQTPNTSGQPGISSPSTTPSSQTPAPGSSLTPQPPTTAPVNSPATPQNPTPPPGSGLTPQPPTTAPVNSPATPQNPTPANNLSPSIPTNSTPTNTPSSSSVPSTNGITPLSSPGNSNSTVPRVTPNQNTTSPGNTFPDERED